MNCTKFNSVLEQDKETAITELWECLGRWSAYLVSNGEQANLSPPEWLRDAVKNATTPQPDRVAELEAKLKEYHAALNNLRSGMAEAKNTNIVDYIDVVLGALDD